jgi:type II secretory ATPase GspE/PulE/Tfp pilus assembly ATPase PilB-like protein
LTNLYFENPNIKDLFSYCVSKDASDVHIMVRDNECIIKVRSLGDLHRVHDLSHEKGNSICRTIYTTMCDSADKNFQPKKAQGARISALFLPDQLSGARVATTPTENGYYMVCRLLYKPKDKNPTLKQLGYEDFHVEDLEKLAAKTSGVTIISGPTGSGKSTTLQVVISDIITQAEGKSHVITVEDPPEYTIFGWEPAKQTIISESQEEITDKKIKCYATQTPVMNVKDSAQKAEKFNLAISAAMRLDPEIIMIGEVRDAASAGAALQAAMTGHQVFTTVHANNALTIFPRLIDIGAKKELACDADVVCGLIAQRLTKKLCPHCCKSLLDNMDEFLKRQGAIATLKRLLVSFGAYKNYEEIKHIKDVNVMLEAIKDVDLSGVRIRNPEGCPNCNFNGLSGRSVVAEIIMTDQKYMELILQDKKAELKKYWYKDLKGIDMQMHGLIKVKQGLADPIEMERELGQFDLHEDIHFDFFYKLLNSYELPTLERMLEKGFYIQDFKNKYPSYFHKPEPTNKTQKTPKLKKAN